MIQYSSERASLDDIKGNPMTNIIFQQSIARKPTNSQLTTFESIAIVRGVFVLCGSTCQKAECGRNLGKVTADSEGRNNTATDRGSQTGDGTFAHSVHPIVDLKIRQIGPENWSKVL